MIESLNDLLSPIEIKLISMVLLILLLLMSRMLGFRIVNRKVSNLHQRMIWRQTLNYATFILAVTITVRIWFEWFQSIITLLSVIAAALTIVSKEILLNLFSYGIIVWRGLFQVGDRIQIDQIAGDVIETGPFYIAITELGNGVHSDEFNGRVVKVPNSLVLVKPVANISRGLNRVWHEITIELSLSANWEKAKRLLFEIANQASNPLEPDERAKIRHLKEEIMFIKTEPCTYVRVEKDKILLTLRYLVKFHKKRQSEAQIWEEILRQFAQHPDLAFPATPETVQVPSSGTPKAEARKRPNQPKSPKTKA